MTLKVLKFLHRKSVGIIQDNENAFTGSSRGHNVFIISYNHIWLTLNAGSADFFYFLWAEKLLVSKLKEALVCQVVGMVTNGKCSAFIQVLLTLALLK